MHFRHKYLILLRYPSKKSCPKTSRVDQLCLLIFVALRFNILGRIFLTSTICCVSEFQSLSWRDFLMVIDLLPAEIRSNYEVHEWKHACAVLSSDFPSEWNDLIEVLTSFKLKKSHIAVGGKNKSKVASAIDGEFTKRGWKEKSFDTKVVIDQTSLKSPTHKVDCFKNRIALEIEWNNKDPFFDRDLNNFRLLFELRAISVGIIITRCDELQEIFDSLGRGKSYGNSTTHMSKLLPRIEGGGGGGCPILVFGISKRLYIEE